MDIISILSIPEVWISLAMLTFMEIILGIDNIIFIAIAAGKLPEKEQKKATNLGLFFAMIFRIILLFGITWLIAAKEPIWSPHAGFFSAGFSIQSLILIAGGLFLIYKSTSEIHHKLEGGGTEVKDSEAGVSTTLTKVVLQICLINIVFSFDSILTAIGMTNGLGSELGEADGATLELIVMISAVIISMAIMMLFATPVGKFVNDHPTIQMLGLSFLILIGFMLVVEGGHLAHLKIAGQEIGAVPKGYLYFAIFFSLVVEFLNMQLRTDTKPNVQLQGLKEQAVKEGIWEKGKKK